MGTPYLTEDFPVLSAGPTPHVPLDRWTFTITNEAGQSTAWSWAELNALSTEEVTVNLHCVTRWSKLGTRWRGVSVDTVLEAVDTAADFERPTPAGPTAREARIWQPKPNAMPTTGGQRRTG